MKRHYVHIISFLLLLLSGGFAFGQGGIKAAAGAKAGQVGDIPLQYLFFGGDTLQGMDINALMADLAAYDAHSHLSVMEKRVYMHYRERDFVRTKYHLPGAAFMDPMKSPDLNADRRHSMSKYKPKWITNPNAIQGTFNGNGQLQRQGGGGNPSILVNQAPDLDFEPVGDFNGGNAPGPVNWITDILYATPGNLQGFWWGHGFDGTFNANPATVCSHHTWVNTGVDKYGSVPMVYPGNLSHSYRLGAPLVNLGGGWNKSECV